VVGLLKAEGVSLPAWVKDPTKKEGKIRNAEKLRRNQPKQEAPAAETEAEAPVVEAEAPAQDA
jgi:hypothetical protein